MNVIWTLVAIFAFAIGMLAGYRVRKNETLGVIRVARSEEDDETYLFLELKFGTRPDDIMSEKFVTFEVSQK